jgi:hypothetical protein
MIVSNENIWTTEIDFGDLTGRDQIDQPEGDLMGSI